MADMNHVYIIGRLTRDAELKCTASGKVVSKLSLAVNEKRKVGDRWKEEASFFEILLWGQIAESLNLYLVKGKQIAVSGKLQQERWDQDGQTRSKVVIIAANIQLLGGTSGNENGGSANTHSRSAPASLTDDGFADDIPF
jgi:single-strand DNA-binding protein